MKIKKLWRLYSLTILIGIFLYFYFRGKNNRTTFYESKINEKIIESSDWQKKTTEYYLEKGLFIDVTLLDSIHLKVGDSISKDANSSEFEIFRKNKFGVYEFYKKYQYED